MNTPPRLLKVAPLSGFRLAVQYSDGTAGTVDLSDLADRGVFAAWREPGVFDAVSIGANGQLKWSDAIELCGDAVYMRLTGKSPEEVFPALNSANADA